MKRGSERYARRVHAIELFLADGALRSARDALNDLIEEVEE